MSFDPSPLTRHRTGLVDPRRRVTLPVEREGETHVEFPIPPGRPVESLGKTPFEETEVLYVQMDRESSPTGPTSEESVVQS